MFNRSGGGRVQAGAAEEGVDLSEISDAIVSHSKVSLKLGHSGLEGKVFVSRYRQLSFARGAEGFAGIFQMPVFR